MRKIIILLILPFIFSCDNEDDNKVRTRSEAAPKEQLAFSSDDFQIITPVPEEIANDYKLDTSYYKKVITVWGIPVLSPSNVDDVLLKNAAEIVALQLSNENLQEGLQESIRDKLFQHYYRIVIYPSDGYKFGSTSVPEFKSFPDSAGYSATKELPLTGVSDLSLDYQREAEITYSGNSLIHEITHSIHLLALRDLMPDFDKKLKQSYENAIKSRLWEGSLFDIGNGMGYISKNELEYLAVGSELWNNVRSSETKEGSTVKTPLYERLRKIDYSLYELLNSFYNENHKLNPKSGIYKGLYNIECPAKYNGSIDMKKLNYNLYIDDELLSISKVNSSQQRKQLNRSYINAFGGYNSIHDLSIRIPDPFNAPSDYRGENYKLEFIYDGEIISKCLLNKSEM